MKTNNSNFKKLSEKEDNSTKPSLSKDTNFFLVKGIKDTCNPTISLRDKIRFLLLQKGISQNELATAVGVSGATISHITAHNWTPSSILKIKISRELGVDSLVIWGHENYFLDWQKGIQKNEEENGTKS